MGQHGIDHLHYEALLSARQVLDALHLLLQLWGGASFARARILLAEQGLDGDGKGGGEGRQAAALGKSSPGLLG